MGFVPAAPASGSWEGDTLTLERSSARGKARIRYAFADTDSYRMTACSFNRPAATSGRTW